MDKIAQKNTALKSQIFITGTLISIICTCTDIAPNNKVQNQFANSPRYFAWNTHIDAEAKEGSTVA